MSRNISVKINNGNETIETVKLNAANKKVIIKAQPNVNYELVDEATQYAPEMIDTKRVGNDLHIAFEGTDINKESDLVLEGYYEHDNTELLLGMAEDGQYYAYVPQSGMESDAVTLLADQVFAPQALGGNSVAAPFWAFNPNWLWMAAGVAAVGGIIAAASGSNGGGSSNNANNNSNTAKDTTAPAKPTVEAKDNGSVEVTPPADADTKSVEVNYTDEAGTPKTATLTKGNDGNWTSNNPDVAVDPVSGKATIPADKVKDGSPVTAKATDNAGNTGEEGTVNAGNNSATPDTTAPSAPEVTPSTTDGSVKVKVPSDAEAGDTVEVTVTPEGSNTPEKVTLTKQPDGSWTSDKPAIVPNVDAGKDSTTIPQDKVKDGSEVTAQAKDPAGNESTPAKANAGNNAATPDTTAPSAPEVTPSTTDGSVKVKVPSDAEVGDTVEVTVTPEGSNTPEKVTLTKQPDGSWTSDKPETVPSVEAGKDSTTIPQDKVKDGSEVTAQAKDPAGNESAESKGNAGNNADHTAPSAPEVTPSTTDGSVKVKVPSDAEVGDTVEVTVTPEGSNTPEKVTLTKQADGSWTSSNPTTLPNVEAGQSSTTIPQDKVKDGSEVTAQAKDPSGNESTPAKANAGNNKVVKLELSLAEDTGASSNDNYTKNGQVNVSGIPSGSEWEYSTDGGQNWTSGSGTSFTLPDNTKVGGIAYNLQARVKGNAASTSDTLNMTLDQKAEEFHAIIDDSMNLIGTAEKNSTISINNRSGQANANGEFEIATGIDPKATAKKVPYTVVETDLAGNTISKDVAYTYYRRYGANTNDSYGSENDVILIGTKGGTGDLGSLIKSSLTTGDGDDSVYAIGVQYHSNTLDMGSGNDFASFGKIAGTINMGDGNDILEARDTRSPFFYLVGGNPTINMGSGNDIVKTSGDTNTKATIDGGSDFDTLEFVNRDGKPITTTISMISNFEKIDITGTLNNSVTISDKDVERNHSAKATVDASGASHNNVLIVDGNAGDKVTLSGISKAASSQVTYEGNTYNVYNTNSNELWVDSDITVA